MTNIKWNQNFWLKENLFDSPFEDRKHPVGEGTQKIYRFDNGYGASIVRFKLIGAFREGREYASYTSNEEEWELAVLKFKGNNKNGTITYTTPLTQDVMGYLSKEQVEDALRQIKSWKKNQY